ncbi:tetratricopeptide repeat protein [Streptomyces sp. NPDC020996]|uniref:tetratricopeptide repeat protein n=1 Tax=Streptomyces sp. NPDC020996 TaxID=3154791 RepID=UPI003406EF42
MARDQGEGMAPRTNDTPPTRKNGTAQAGKHDTAPTGENRTTSAGKHDTAPPPPPRAGHPGNGSPGNGSAADGSAADGSAADAADERVVTVRRMAAIGRRVRGLRFGGSALLLAVALTAGSLAVGALRDHTAPAVAAAPAALSPALLNSGDLDAGIAALQAHLRAQPRDFGGWATLGLAYVEQARTKGDPARYPQAEKALDRSLGIEPGNDQALAGRAALAAARHDFAGALTYADRALKQNPYSERALSSRIDALVELGRYTAASKAADTADSRRPGVPVFTRYAYVHELRGDVRTARRVLEQALAGAATRGDVAYVATQLGQLAWNQGDYAGALTRYARALAADEDYLPALEGRARAQFASGDRAAAIRGMEQVVARYPLPGPLVLLGELYEDRGAGGDRARAAQQYALVDAWTALARANGVDADLDTALAAADHGDRTAALRAARAEWSRRHTVHTADALAWALHVNGRDEEALPYARRATATGYRNAAFLYHRGVIERATGHGDRARTLLRAALKLNPGFSPLGAREARAALEASR